MFFLRKFLAATLFPVALCVELMVIGIFLLLMTRRKILGKIFLSAGILIFLLVSQNVASDALLKPLESAYPALQEPSQIASKSPGNIRWIVVLGGGYSFDPDLPVTSRLSPASIYRLIEGIRLLRGFPGSRLILSGGTIWNKESEGKGFQRLAIALGVDKQRIILEEKSRTTRDQAVNIKKIIGNDRQVLVTSASHMPRAMSMFQKEEMDPIPAPTDHRVLKNPSPVYMRLIPNADALVKSKRSFYEYLGLTWAKLRGDIN
jgi:uncharacterized SAM-binding protein YcdF (DUF218 family)